MIGGKRMGYKLKKAADDFLKTPQGARLAGKRGELGRIANSSDGRKLQSMFDSKGIQTALENGDMSAVKTAMSDIMNTDAGARVIESLNEILNR